MPTWISVIYDAFRSLAEGVSTITIDELPERIELIGEALADPRTNPATFFLGASIALIVFLIIIVLAVLAWLLFTRDRTNQLNYEVLDGDGVVLAVIPVQEAEEVSAFIGATDKPISSDDTSRDYQRSDDGRSSVRRFDFDRAARYSLRFLLVAGAISALLIAVAGSTRSRAFCSSCHEVDNHMVAEATDVHAHVSCIACHETGSTVQVFTTNVGARINHVAAGLLGNQTRVERYGRVSATSCLRCHEEAIGQTTRRGDDVALRMSHTGPLEAHMGCLTCHVINERQEQGKPDRGMEICLKCHNDEIASTGCDLCHVKSPLTYATRSHWNFANELLANTDPQQGCYRCHDPGPCDSCHGIRMPHPQDFMAMSSPGHPEASRGIDLSGCFYCHDGSSTMGATDCYDCHPRGTL